MPVCCGVTPEFIVRGLHPDAVRFNFSENLLPRADCDATGKQPLLAESTMIAKYLYGSRYIEEVQTPICRIAVQQMPWRPKKSIST
jgi:hypothetical protein